MNIILWDLQHPFPSFGECAENVRCTGNSGHYHLFVSVQPEPSGQNLTN
ncbi:hypothetical protein SD22575_2282 [Shigella dysenteriae 225-75]|nr:hypothetical protein SD22575_2282 [Shigella dysenteriae 225-75]